MDIIDDLFIKRKVYISTVGWISAILSGLMIYFSIWGIIDVIIFNQNPMFKELPINGQPEIAQHFFKTYVMMSMIYGLSIIFGIFFLISSIGLIKYKDWGRIIFIIVSWILIIISLAAIVFYIIFSRKLLSGMISGTIPMTGFDEMTDFLKTMLRVRFVSYGILLIVILRALFRNILRFKQKDYKRLFY